MNKGQVSRKKRTFDPSIVKKAFDVSRRIADRLTDPADVKRIVKQPDNVSIMGANPWGGETSLSHGYPGMVLFFAIQDRFYPDQKWDEKAHHHILQIKKALDEQGIASLSMFSGLSGIAFAIQAASRQGERYRNFLQLLNTVLEEQVVRLIEEDRHRSRVEQGVSPKVYDVIAGMSGIGRYVMSQSHSHAGFTVILEKMLQRMAGLSQMIKVDDRWVPGWYVPQKYQFLEREKTYFPRGNFNCGLAHGIPGPLAFLSLATLKGYRVEGQRDAIRFISDWLLKKVYEDEYGLLWPDRIRFEDELQGTRSEKYFTREAWCYGTPGVARALYLAGSALDDKHIKEKAVTALKASLSRPKEMWKIESPTFCHGKAGLLQILIRMAEDTGEEYFYQRAKDLAMWIIEQFQEEAPFGYRDIEGDRALNKVGLLEGVSGIGLALMSLGEEKHMDWDAAFLIS